MPRLTRRQLVGKDEDIERQEREEELRALEVELHKAQREEVVISLPVVSEPTQVAV